VGRPVPGTHEGAPRLRQFDDAAGLCQASARRHVRLHHLHAAALHEVEEFPAGDGVFTGGDAQRGLRRQLRVGVHAVHREGSLEEEDVEFLQLPQCRHRRTHIVPQVAHIDAEHRLGSQRLTGAPREFDDGLQVLVHGLHLEGAVAEFTQTQDAIHLFTQHAVPIPAVGDDGAVGYDAAWCVAAHDLVA
jgi:hypothetical protein